MFAAIRRARASRAVFALVVTSIALVIAASAGLTGPFIAHAASQLATSQTLSANCSAFDFRPIDDTGQDYFGAKRIRAGTGGSGFFTCNPGLPSGAVVTKVQFSIWDGSGSSEVKFCGLYRSGLTGTTYDTVEELAAVPPTGLAQAPGFARLTDRKIKNATINTNDYVYWLQCNLGQAGQSLGLFGANVLYNIPAQNG
jgi:hypothetical protein